MEREGEGPVVDSSPLSSNPPLQSVAAVEVGDGFEGGGGGGSGGGGVALSEVIGEERKEDQQVVYLSE
uniref:Uncharacterized protein n=1 Tax=Nelumbo nucifera TaxID=4432 RepID=A0A822Y4Z0_NELNU|nr:TPA_asm: hypothetical protein HUJ06_028985 [Nelumbo nucifera]